MSRTFCLSPSLSFLLPFSSSLPQPPPSLLFSPLLFFAGSAAFSLGRWRAKLLLLLLRSCTLCIRFKYHGSARFEGLPAPARSPSPPPPRLSLFCASLRRYELGRTRGEDAAFKGRSREAETKPVVWVPTPFVHRPDASIQRERRREPRASNIEGHRRVSVTLSLLRS